MKPVLPTLEEIKNYTDKPPKWFVELIELAMIEWGPDGHTDGSEEIAAITWHLARSKKADENDQF